MISDIKAFNEFKNHKSITKLSQLNKIYIKKQVVEVSGCNKQKRFGIHEFQSDSQYIAQAIIYITEFNDFCNRQFCSGEWSVFLEFDRPQKCTFCCFQRPEIYINFKTSTSTFYIGKVVVPFKLFNSSYQLDTFDNNNNLKYIMKESCCSCNICCGGCKCKKAFNEEYFRIYDNNYQQLSTVKSISYNCQRSCLQAIYDKIHQFPKNISPQDKILLIATIIMYDFDIF
ncbi:hypothetical protein ABPG72_017538 [Tetrahymena utriculariae]